MRRSLGLVAAAALLAGLAAIVPTAPVAGTCAGAGPNHSSLVVEHGNGSVVTRCVAFGTASITGKDLLDASGISWSGQTFGGYGVAVCAVDGEPVSYSSCPGATNYWALFLERGGGSWQLTALGVSSLSLADGDGLGLRYVPTAGTPPVPVTAAGVCAAAVPTPTRATAVATPRPVATGAVTATPAGSGTAGATATVTATAATSLATTADATATAGATANATATPAPAPGGGGGGPDIGLLAAAVAAGGLGGLAVLRLLAARRPAR